MKDRRRAKGLAAAAVAVVAESNAGDPARAVAMWKVFSKAGYPGILALIPIVNWFIQVKIAGFSAWWGLLAIVPLVNVVFFIIVAIRIGRGFGHGAFFSIVLLLLFAPIGFFIVGFSSDRYTSPA